MITCRFENGNKAHLRHVTVIAIIIEGGKILLGKRTPVAGKVMMEAGKWGLIGGFMDRDENLSQAVRREVGEETAYVIDEPVLFRIKDYRDNVSAKEDRQNFELVFTAKPLKQEGIMDKEFSELRWFPLDQLPDEEEIAFDHNEDIQLYKEYLEKKFDLPLIGDRSIPSVIPRMRRR